MLFIKIKIWLFSTVYETKPVLNFIVPDSSHFELISYVANERSDLKEIEDIFGKIYFALDYF